MTPNKIITAQGTYILEGVWMRILRRALIIILSLVGMIIISAAIIGFSHPAQTSRPTQANFAILHKAEKAGGKNCRLEWNEIQNDHEVICG